MMVFVMIGIESLILPIGARVDGSGKALDMDFDGVIDLKDKCVTVPGLVENYGCPYIDENTLVIVDENTKNSLKELYLI